MQKLKYIKLFEELTSSVTAEEIITRMRAYAEASINTARVSETKKMDGALVFEVYSTMPDESGDGKKKFVVLVPIKNPFSAIAQTVENDKVTFVATLEPGGESDIIDMLTNYIEALNLYDDASVDQVVNAWKEITKPDDVKLVIKALG